MLRTVVRERWLEASAAIGFWPANAEGDDIVLCENGRREKPIAMLHTLRQQMARESDKPNLALADRLAEAFAERLHARVRREFWAYAPDENFSCDELIAEGYRGIRPAPGYPAQPDHTEKGTLFALLDAENRIGVKLTESYAMWPGSSVSGFYFSHPESRYFGIGKIERDQVEDYARRKGWAIAEAERWLSPLLNYDPKAAAA